MREMMVMLACPLTPQLSHNQCLSSYKKVGPARHVYTFVPCPFLSAGIYWRFDDKEHSAESFRKISLRSKNNSRKSVGCG